MQGLQCAESGGAAVIRKSGYAVSHDTVHKCKHGRKASALHVRAFSDAFGCRPAWLLSGEGSPLARPPRGPGEGSPPDALLRSAMEGPADSAVEEWRRFSGATDGPLRPTIVRSWERSRAAGVERCGGPAGALRPPRLPSDEIEAHRRRNRRLLQVASPHLEWLTSLQPHLEHVVHLVAADGIVLESRGRPEELRETWFLLPGYDWSEDAMGTNGAGTAPAAGKATAVIGPEHCVEAYRGCTCVAAPARGPDGEVVGALDQSTTLDAGDPGRLVVVAHAAENVGREVGSPAAP